MINLKLSKNGQRGQVALVVLLVSAVVMTIGLSSAKKTTVETRIESNEEQLKQAFNAAESGIEYYFGTGKTDFTSIDNLSTADVTVKNIGQGSTINLDSYTLVNTNSNFWLVGHAADGSIDYASTYTGNSLSLCVENSFNGALKIDYFYRSGGVFKVKRYGENFSDNYVSGFTNGGQSLGQGGCITNYRELTVAAPLAGNTPLLLVAKPMRAGTKIYLRGSGASFPTQGIELTSVGKVGDGDAQASTIVNRTLRVVRTYQVPSFLVDAVTSYGNVLSN